MFDMMVFGFVVGAAFAAIFQRAWNQRTPSLLYSSAGWLAGFTVLGAIGMYSGPHAKSGVGAMAFVIVCVVLLACSGFLVSRRKPEPSRVQSSQDRQYGHI